MFQISPQKKIDLFQSFISGLPETEDLQEIFEHFFKFVELFYTPLSKDIAVGTFLLNESSFDFELANFFPHKPEKKFIENQIEEIISKNYLPDALNDGKIFPLQVEGSELYLSKIIIPLVSIKGPVGYLLLFCGVEPARIPQDYIDLLKLVSFQLGTWVRNFQVETLQKEFDSRLDNAIHLEVRRLEEHNQELEKLRKLAENDKQDILKTNQDKSEFLASVSHELRTPLSSILGFTDLLTSESLSEQGQEYLHIIQKSSEGLLSVINDILEFTQVENHSLKLSETPFNLSEEIESIIDLLSIAAKNNSVDLNWEISGIESNQWLVGDPFRLRQVLIALLNNAIGNSPHGFVKLWIIGSDNAAKQAQRLKFVIEDNGNGYTPEQISDLFSSFTYFENHQTNKPRSSGLGLAISKKLVDKMGGNLNATSTEGKGSEFYFTIDLPRSFSSHLPDSIIDSQSEEQLINSPNKTAFIVEDNIFNRKLIKKILQTWNFEIFEAENGKEAVHHLYNGLNPDIILMDYQMPIMDGIEAANYIRIWESKNQKERTPIIALTARALREERDYFLTAGFDEYLLKPFSKKDLLKVFLKVFDLETE